MTLVRPKSETREAWQYTGQPPSEWPTWAYLFETYPGGPLLLVRRSGAQAFNKTEWLLRNLDSRDPDWLTHDQMRKEYEEVVT